MNKPVFTHDDVIFVLWMAMARLRATDGREGDKARDLAARIASTLPEEPK